MKVNLIMAMAAELCGRKDLSEYLTGKSAENLGEAERDTESLLRCYNLTENEIALDYLPLCKTETLVSDGKILYSAFERSPLEIESVRKSDGGKLPFRIAEDGVCVQSGEVSVTYTYRPSVKAREDEAELDRKGDARLMALGTACEFSLMNGMFDAASLLDKRYRDALACACRDRSGRMKMRSWI